MTYPDDYRALVAGARRILCDIDGCLIRGGQPIDGAAAFVGAVRDRLALVSNNSTDTAKGLSDRLARIGIEVPETQIFLAGEQTLLHVQAAYPDARVRLIATDAIRDRAETLGLHLTTERPDLIVLCRAPDTTLAELESVLVQITHGVSAITANPDLTHPGAAGPAIETGAVAGMLQTCRPGLSIPFVGKPAAPLFLLGLQNAAPDEAIMVGDNPETDIIGAKRLRIPALLIHPDTSMGPTIASLI
ncbi:HAD hydrolase-like protein [Cereibacter sp. SYSU M97828]|nr:HAD hydrolase-like protein [Cereibacter flavus]